MFRIYALLIGYAFGLIQTAYFIGKAHGIDIREHGSKGAGATNTNRVLGRKAGILVFIVDILKTVVAFWVAVAIFTDWDRVRWTLTGFSYTLWNPNYIGFLAGMYAAVGAVLGHCFPFYLKFRGGKGISCMVGLMLIVLDWRAIIIIAVIAIAAIAIFRYISLASLIITAFAPVALAVFGARPEMLIGTDLQNYFDDMIMTVPLTSRTIDEAVVIMITLAVLAWWLHRGNIRRLISGTERKFSFKKRTTQEGETQ